MDQVLLASIDISINKAWTSVALKMPTQRWRDYQPPGGFSTESKRPITDESLFSAAEYRSCKIIQLYAQGARYRVQHVRYDMDIDVSSERSVDRQHHVLEASLRIILQRLPPWPSSRRLSWRCRPLRYTVWPRHQMGDDRQAGMVRRIGAWAMERKGVMKAYLSRLHNTRFLHPISRCESSLQSVRVSPRRSTDPQKSAWTFMNWLKWPVSANRIFTDCLRNNTANHLEPIWNGLELNTIIGWSEKSLPYRSRLWPWISALKQASTFLPSSKNIPASLLVNGEGSTVLFRSVN